MRFHNGHCRVCLLRTVVVDAPVAVAMGGGNLAAPRIRWDRLVRTGMTTDDAHRHREQEEHSVNEHQTLRAFRDLADRLRADTRSSRTTVRVDCERFDLKLETVAVESRAEGVRALEGQSTPKARYSPAVNWLRENRRTFVMEDCLNPWAPEVAPDDYVTDLYGIRSEMVAGVFRDGDVAGLVSVHYTDGPRVWSEAEVAMIEQVCDQVKAILDGLDGG